MATLGIGVAVLVLSLSGPAWSQQTAPSDGVPMQTGDQARGVCEQAPWILDEVCGVLGDPVGGGIRTVVGGGTSAVLAGVVGFVVEGAGWLLNEVASVVDASTRPQLTSDWFQAAYRDMSVVAVMGLLPFLLLALIQGIVRQDAGLLLRATFAYVPLAAIGTAAAVVVVDLVVELTDQLSAWVGGSMGSDLSAFATGMGTALAAVSLGSGGVAGLAALLGAGVVAFAAFVIWLELLLRQAAIYVAVLFVPLGFMAMVWPATAHWLRRLAQGLVAIVLSKLVIVAVMALAAGALGADVADEGFSVVVSGAALLALAALAPYVLLRLIPVFEAGLTAQLEGTLRRPTAAVAPPVTGTQMVGLLRQRVASGSGHQAGGWSDSKAGVPTGGPPEGPPPSRPPAVPGGSGGGPSAGGSAAPGAAATTAGAGVAAARRAVTSARRRAGQGIAATASGATQKPPSAMRARPPAQAWHDAANRSGTVREGDG